VPEPFAEGDLCLVVDSKGRRYLLKLVAGGEFKTHMGVIPHSDMIGTPEGTFCEAATGARFITVRPRLMDFILKMKRGAQVVYPKDIGPILVYADIAPGCTVVEAGTGSGALTMALTRAVGPTGRVVTVERREDHAKHARAGLERWFGGWPDHLELVIGEVENVIESVQPDRIVLDVPEPWHAAGVAAEHLQPGGLFCSYVPTVPQMQQTVQHLKAAHAFVDIENFEALIRTWNVDGRSVRPDHQMVGHTGFITVARKVIPW